MRTVVDAPEFERWRATAGEALLAARANRDVGLPHFACFHYEQAAQHALKGLLHAVGAGVRGHDLVALAHRLGEAVGVEPDTSLHDAVKRLSRHYQASRYPDAYPVGTASAHYADSDAEQAQADAQSVLGWVDDVWARLRDEADQ
jgi:HEPN domain-containing protein